MKNLVTFWAAEIALVADKYHLAASLPMRSSRWNNDCIRFRTEDDFSGSESIISKTSGFVIQNSTYLNHSSDLVRGCANPINLSRHDISNSIAAKVDFLPYF